MRFTLTEEQRSFAGALDGLLAGADVPAVSRAWATGDTAAGLALWGRLSEMGVTALTVPEDLGGLDGTPLDLVVAFERLGFHGVPGPWLETVALAPPLLAGTRHEPVLTEVADGTALITVAAPPQAPYAVDAVVATHAFLASADGGLSPARPGAGLTSVDPSRHLCVLETAGTGETLPAGALDRALDRAALAASAMLVGAAEQMLAQSVAYVGQRKQFGRVIGEYQAVKHALAEVKVAIDFARPLVLGAALALEDGGPDGARDASAAKVATSDAALLAGRTALQVHGAIGYTQEYDLSLWILRTRALAGAWGTASYHRARVLDHLMRS
jgi:alkylation response protein AidB-like acyl-CoA dehydrogenase